LSDRAFNGRVYFSENALLPGLVEAEYKNHRLASELFGKLSTLPEGDMRYNSLNGSFFEKVYKFVIKEK